MEREQQLTHATPQRHREDPHHRLRPHRHRTVGRVRLLRRAGLQGAQVRRLRGGAGQFQPGHHHDRSGDGRPHLHRAAHAHLSGRNHPRRSRDADLRRTARHLRRAADGRRPDGSEPRRRTGRQRHPGEVRRAAHRRAARRHQEGRRPPALQRCHDQDRPRSSEVGAWSTI